MFEMPINVIMLDSSNACVHCYFTSFDNSSVAYKIEVQGKIFDSESKQSRIHIDQSQNNSSSYFNPSRFTYVDGYNSVFTDFINFLSQLFNDQSEQKCYEIIREIKEKCKNTLIFNNAYVNIDLNLVAKMQLYKKFQELLDRYLIQQIFRLSVRFSGSSVFYEFIFNYWFVNRHESNIANEVYIKPKENNKIDYCFNKLDELGIKYKKIAPYSAILYNEHDTNLLKLTDNDLFDCIHFRPIVEIINELKLQV